jgi:hypothetical protein
MPSKKQIPQKIEKHSLFEAMKAPQPIFAPVRFEVTHMQANGAGRYEVTLCERRQPDPAPQPAVTPILIKSDCTAGQTPLQYLTLAVTADEFARYRIGQEFALVFGEGISFKFDESRSE